MLDIFYKIFILQDDASSWIIEALIFIVAYGYFVCKCTLSGLIVLPKNKAKRYKIIKNIILVGVIWESSILLCYFIFFPSFNITVFDNTTLLAIVIFLTFICYCSLIWLLTIISARIANRKFD
jgi:hypothetical protein